MYLQGNPVSPAYIRPPVPPVIPDSDIMQHMQARAAALRCAGGNGQVLCGDMGLFPAHLPQCATTAGFADAVASTTLALCARLYPTFMRGMRGQWIVSSVVVEDTVARRCAVVAVGMGTKFLHKQVAQAHGVGKFLVKDSHAEVRASCGAHGHAGVTPLVALTTNIYVDY